MILGIDASRCRSGGAIAHLKGILGHFRPGLRNNIEKIHVWTYDKLHQQLADEEWLVKHRPASLNGSLASQLTWQAFQLSKDLRAHQCQILFTVDASTLCNFRPQVVLSQDMLSYEPGIMQMYRGKARLRLEMILRVQNRAFRRAAGVIFLTQYASRVIQQSSGPLKNYTCIPHGFDEKFSGAAERRDPSKGSNATYRCLYISNAALYKYQWEVVEAIAMLRAKGLDIELTLVGGGSGPAQERLNAAITQYDPEGRFVRQHAFVPHDELTSFLAGADIFIFASGCENMPVTLLEAMAAGLPIASSNRGPMPEVLGDAGIYFNPERADEIAQAVYAFITDENLRTTRAQLARQHAAQYSWQRCAHETWQFIQKTYESLN